MKKVPKKETPAPSAHKVCDQSVKPAHEKLRFRFRRPDAQVVALVGSFTEWESQPILLALAGGEVGLWEVEITLPSGKHEYMFLVDAQEWVLDPEATQSAANLWGGFNSVIEVGAQ